MNPLLSRPGSLGAPRRGPGAKAAKRHDVSRALRPPPVVYDFRHCVHRFDGVASLTMFILIYAYVIFLRMMTVTMEFWDLM